MDEEKNQVEAILFAVGQKIPLTQIAKLTGLKKPTIVEHIHTLQKEYQARNAPLKFTSEEDETIWKLTIREQYLGVIRKVNPYTELSKTILETLAVIAWKQPIRQSEVIDIRTNKAYDHIEELENIGFINKEKHGRTYLIKVTQKFLNYFDIDDAAKLRGLFKNFKDMGEFQQKVENFLDDVKNPPLLIEGQREEPQDTFAHKFHEKQEREAKEKQKAEEAEAKKLQKQQEREAKKAAKKQEKEDNKNKETQSE